MRADLRRDPVALRRSLNRHGFVGRTGLDREDTAALARAEVPEFPLGREVVMQPFPAMASGPKSDIRILTAPRPKRASKHPVEGVSLVLVPVEDQAVDASVDGLHIGELACRRMRRSRIENQHSTWLSQDACFGVSTKVTRSPCRSLNVVQRASASSKCTLRLSQITTTLPGVRAAMASMNATRSSAVRRARHSP